MTRINLDHDFERNSKHQMRHYRKNILIAATLLCSVEVEGHDRKQSDL